ncbi:MAG: hypothetical protein AAFV53_24515 [Myxococcota bacterium]
MRTALLIGLGVAACDTPESKPLAEMTMQRTKETGTSDLEKRLAAQEKKLVELEDQLKETEEELAKTQSDLEKQQLEVVQLETELSTLGDTALTSSDLDGYATAVDLDDATRRVGVIESDYLTSVDAERFTVPASLLSLASYVEVNTVTDDVIFTGANVQIQSGSGETYGKGNGLGNLIVGYNKMPLGDVDRTGSHNLIIGDGHNWEGNGNLLSGKENVIRSDAGAILAGQSNEVYGENGVIVGGMGNVVWGRDNTIVNSVDSFIRGQNDTVVGGRNHEDHGYYNNGSYSVIVGGSDSLMYGTLGVIVGGSQNVTYDYYGSILGGRENSSLGSYNAIINSVNSVVQGGRGLNRSNGAWSNGYNTIMGGHDHWTTEWTFGSTILGGSDTLLEDTVFTNQIGGKDVDESGSRRTIVEETAF